MAEADALAALAERIVLPCFAAAALDEAQAASVVQAALAPLIGATPGFARAPDGTWWRERGRVIDMVIPEMLALSRFVRLWVAVWHHELRHGLSGPVPEGVTHAAAHTLGRDGIDGEPLEALVALPTAAAVSASIAMALRWFDGICNPADVMAQVREEYRRAMGTRCYE